MGKRKSSSRKPVRTTKAHPLPTTFTCLFCNHEKSVTVKLDRRAGVGQVHCCICGQNFQCPVNYLSAPVDVYGEWVDAAEEVSLQDTGKGSIGNNDRTSSSRVGAKTGEHADYRQQRVNADDDDY